MLSKKPVRTADEDEEYRMRISLQNIFACAPENEMESVAAEIETTLSDDLKREVDKYMRGK